MNNSACNVAVIGLGNEWRGDASVGLLAAQEVHRRVPETSIFTGVGDARNIARAWQHVPYAIVIVATTDSGPPGQISRFNLVAGTVPAALSCTLTHGKNLAEALAISRQAKQLPEHLLVFTVGADSVTAGNDLSPAVSAALPVLVERVVGEIVSVTPETAGVNRE